MQLTLIAARVQQNFLKIEEDVFLKVGDLSRLLERPPATFFGSIGTVRKFTNTTFLRQLQLFKPSLSQHPSPSFLLRK